MVELENEAETTNAKMAKLEERATNQEVQLGRAVAELTQQAQKFKKTEAELIEDAADAYVAGFEDALAQVACAHPEMDASPFATTSWMGRSCQGLHHPSLYFVSKQTILFYIYKRLVLFQLSELFTCFKSSTALTFSILFCLNAVHNLLYLAFFVFDC